MLVDASATAMEGHIKGLSESQVGKSRLGTERLNISFPR